MTAPTPEQADLTIAICGEPGHTGHFARITVGYTDHVAAFCLTPERARRFLGEALTGRPQPQAAVASPEETAALRQIASGTLTAEAAAAIAQRALEATST